MVAENALFHHRLYEVQIQKINGKKQKLSTLSRKSLQFESKNYLSFIILKLKLIYTFKLKI